VIRGSGKWKWWEGGVVIVCFVLCFSLIVGVFMWAALGAWFVVVGTAVVSTVVNLGTALVSTLVLFFGSWRLLIYGILVSVIAIELYNLFCNVVQELFNWVTSQLGGVSSPDGMPGEGYTFADLAAWFGYHLKISQCLSFIFAAIAFKWIVVKIPFVKW
jgi:hypothetical protein